MESEIKVSDLPDFDLAEYLRDENDIAAYLTMVIEDGDMSELSHALGVAARAKGMTEVARKSGLTREALYKALRRNANPRFDTINKVCNALGVKLEVVPSDNEQLRCEEREIVSAKTSDPNLICLLCTSGDGNSLLFTGSLEDGQKLVSSVQGINYQLSHIGGCDDC
jgi:probable addiction module antidote protein